jgi:hypothetical protein
MTTKGATAGTGNGRDRQRQGQATAGTGNGKDLTAKTNAQISVVAGS